MLNNSVRVKFERGDIFDIPMETELPASLLYQKDLGNGNATYVRDLERYGRVLVVDVVSPPIFSKHIWRNSIYFMSFPDDDAVWVFHTYKLDEAVKREIRRDADGREVIFKQGVHPAGMPILYK